MKHPEYSKAVNEYQGRSEEPRLPREVRIAFKDRMIEFNKRVEDIINRKK
jgi:hypothetical protein